MHNKSDHMVNYVDIINDQNNVMSDTLIGFDAIHTCLQITSFYASVIYCMFDMSKYKVWYCYKICKQ